MLTDKEARSAKAQDKPFKLADGGGLHLYVSTSGAKLWRVKYRFAGKEKLLSLGTFPTLTLAAARTERDRAKAVLATGRDPSISRRMEVAARANPDTTFEAMARAWHALNKSTWTERHAADVLSSLENSVFAVLGKAQVADIMPRDVIAALRVIEERPAVETAHRVRQRMSAVFIHAIALGVCNADPAHVVRGAMAPIKHGRQPAITDLAEAKAMLRAVEAINAHPVTRLGLRLLALTALRPGELRGARWTEFEGLEGPEPLWTVPAERMKMRREHLVPLSRQAVEVLDALRPLTGRGPLPFPNVRWAHRPMSENAMGYLLNRAGFHGKHVPHGWRSTFATVMNERFRADAPVIDLMLAHKPVNKIEAAYNRALHMERRRELAQLWADLLLEDMPPAASLVDLPRR